MAITILKKTFISLQQIATWLSENAVPDYFASVSYANNAIDCKDSENHIVFSFGRDQLSFRKSGSSTETISGGVAPASNHPASVGKCANGILILIENDSNSVIVSILITKNNNGEVAAVFNYYSSSRYREMVHTYNVHVCAVGDYGGSAADIRTLNFNNSEKNQTQLVQFNTTPPEGTISYTPKAFYMPCSQVHDIYFGKFFANGKWYLTNGYWAIEDEEE